MQQKMTAVFLPGNSSVEIREVPVPKVGIGQVLLKIKASGICGSDIHYIYHEHKGDKKKGTAYLNVVAGHEPCGEIIAVGQGCKHFKERDRVIVYHISGCGFCRNCRKGFPISCTGSSRQAYGWQRDGGHAEFLLAEEKDLVSLPDSLSWGDGSFISCGVGTAYEGILRGNVSGSDTILVVGLGPVGLAAAMLARGRGAGKIIGVDREHNRLERAKALQLVDYGYVPQEDTLEEIREQTKGGASFSIDCSGNPKGRLLALQGASEWGRTVYIGETGTVTFQVSDDLMHKQRTLYGSWVTSLAHMEDCCEDLAKWKKHPDIIVEKILPLSKAAEAYELMANGKCGKILLNPEL